MTISCSSADMVPNECHSIGARSGTTSLFLLSSIKACSLVSGLPSFKIQIYTWMVDSIDSQVMVDSDGTLS